MGTIPAPNIAQEAGEVARTPMDALSEYARVAGLKAQTAQLQQQTQQEAAMNPLRQQQAQQQIEAQRRQMADQDALTKAITAYDPDKHTLADIPKLVTQNGGSGQAALQAQAGLVQQRENLAKLSDEQFTQEQKKSDLIQGVHDQVSQASPEQKQQTYQQGLQTLGRAGVDVSKEPAQYPGDDAFAQHLPAIRLHSAIVAEAEKDREIAAKEQTAAAAQTAAEARKLNAGRAPAPEQEFQAYYKSYLGAKGLEPTPVNEYAARQQFMAAHRASSTTVSNTDVKDIADAIESGDQPPTLTGLYRNAAPVRAELGRRGVPIAKMETDWKATQKYMGTLNGAQQVRLRQAVETASDSLDKIEGLYNEWQQVAPTSGFKILNKASLASMKQLPGRPGAVANALDAQIADLTAELGNVYMGGNSPTDHSLSLAGKNLQSDWNKETFDEALKQARANIKIRQNSITHGAPAGVSGDNSYFSKPDTSGGSPNSQPTDFFSKFGGKPRQ